MWLIVLSDQLRIVALVGHYPNQLANPARAHPRAEAEATIWRLHLSGDASCGISPSFLGLSRSPGQVAHVLLTRSPLYSPRRAFSFDLHVLSTPPAFVLSQDQTLHDINCVEESRHHEDERAPGLASCVGISPSTTFDGSISFSLAISSARQKAREDDARCSVFKDRAPTGTRLHGQGLVIGAGRLAVTNAGDSLSCRCEGPRARVPTGIGAGPVIVTQPPAPLKPVARASRL